MNVLIGYDGSRCADDAMRDLARAGLPASLNAHVISVAEVWLPTESGAATPAGGDVPRSVLKARERARKEVEGARSEADAVADRLRSDHPGWLVTAEGIADSPAWGLLKHASGWPADMIVVGSHGKSALGRFVMGSVSQKILTEAQCTVRIARGRDVPDDQPIRLVIAYDGSPDAANAVEAVTRRCWAPGTSLLFLSVLDPIVASPSPPLNALPTWGADAHRDELHWVLDAHHRNVESLTQAGFNAESKIIEGDPRKTIPREAEEWGADCIFLGARGLNSVERFLLGSVSAAIAARALCTVEVVRSARARK